ncbi:MAG: hypothetical protein EOM87_07930 [Clostridia bacterium]|nr:hypothetical protein [Clostridia bacterium]
MDKPTEWTYGGKLDWSSADSLRLAPVKPVIDCLVQAIRERWLACYLRTKAVTWDWTVEEWGKVKEYKELTLPYQAFSGIYSDIINLITYSLNYTEDPYIEGLDVPVFWEQEDLLEYLNISNFSKPNRLNSYSADWVFKCYKILNALKIFTTVYYTSYWPVDASSQYTTKEGVQCAPYKSRYRVATISGEGVSWADLMAKYVTQDEDEETSYPGEYIKRSSAHIFYNNENYRGFTASRYRTRYSAYVFGVGNTTVRLTTNYKLYLSFLRGSSSSFIFDNHGDSNVENSIIKYQIEETLTENTDFVFTNYIPISDSFTQPTPPKIGEPSDERAYGLTGYSGSGERRTFVVTTEPDFAFNDNE